MNITQEQKILNHLQQGQPITPMDAVKYYDIYRLSAVVLKLRRAGHHIIRYSERNSSGKGTHARYELVKEVAV